MVLIKIAESQFTLDQIHTPEEALANLEVRGRFFEKVAELKKVAPKAKDFLYFSCVMLHACSAALIDQETGKPKLGKDGKPITAKWEINPKTGSWKWICSDPNIKSFRNNNGDIFLLLFKSTILVFLTIPHLVKTKIDLFKSLYVTIALILDLISNFSNPVNKSEKSILI